MSEIKGEEKSIHALTIAYQFKQNEIDKHKKQLTVLEAVSYTHLTLPTTYSV